MKQQQTLPSMAKYLSIFIYSLVAGNVTPLKMDYETISFIDYTSNGMFLSLNLSTHKSWPYDKLESDNTKQCNTYKF